MSEPAATRRTAPADVAERVRAWQAAGTRAVVARATELRGFSTWPADELVAVSDTGEQAGDLLGGYGAEELLSGAGAALAEPRAPQRVRIEVSDTDAVALGLACGGQAELLLQPTDTVPARMWDLLAAREPVALLTRLDGPDSTVVTGDGSTCGAAASEDQVTAATAALAAGHTTAARIDDPDGAVLLEAWVPPPRVVVVGSGDVAAAIDRQGRLLGWETRATEDLDTLDAHLAWAGASSALAVLSHEPHVDVPALRAALQGSVAYVGAMGSRRTQARRLEQLRADGVGEVALDRIHRPIGLDLGGRGAGELALSICAEILATRCGRDARPLAQRGVAIHDRPADAVE